MPAASPNELADALEEAFTESNAIAVLNSPAREQPRKLLVKHQDEVLSVWIYIWTLTHGGRQTLPDEYRVQMTGVEPPLIPNPEGFTLLMGLEPDTGAFAGFDLTQHTNFTIGSPSVQINLGCVHQALQDGIAFTRKSNNEIAIGVRADQMLHYTLNSVELHRLGKDVNMPELLSRASSLLDIEPAAIESLGTERERILAKVRKWSRTASFRQQVLSAYDNRCAVTRTQLKLVDAAHILPVHVEKSTDQVNNGVALSPTFHRAFDHGLIYLDEQYIMRLNLYAKERLASLGLDGGIRRFGEMLDQKIHFPQDAGQRPSLRMIRAANEMRGISA